MSLPRTTFLVILIGTAIWCGLILAAPLLAQGDSSFAGPIYEAFHRVCHQLDEHSLHLGGKPLPVCARCSAIYFSFLVGVLVYPVVRRLKEPKVPPRAVVIGAVIPMMVDVATGMLGLHEVTTATRLATGAMFGLVIPFVILPVAIEGVSQLMYTSHIINKQKGTIDA